MQANGQLFQCLLMLAAELPLVWLWASEQRTVKSSPGNRTVQDKELLS